MITCNLMGGFGNQLFQIFTTIAHALRNNYEYKFDYNVKLYNRNTYWDSFLVHLQVLPLHHCNIIYSEKSFNYNAIPSIDNITLSGYFQSYKYFEDNYDTIINLIQLKEQQEIIKKKYDYPYHNSCSMHFRLGDYKNKQQYHPLASYEYYKKSLEQVNSTVLYTILYFCEEEDNEDVLDTINRLSKDTNIQFIKVNDSIPDWEQLLIMSCCQHNIIANSTFSWWGAYFNTNKNKIVCYPEKWFGYALEHNTDDLFPSTWTKII